MKTNEEINKYFTEVVFKRCWHELNNLEEDTPESWHKYMKCEKCGFLNPNPDKHPDYFADWNGFGALWEWAVKQDWWDDFQRQHDCIYDHRFYALDIKCINYKTFARDLCGFLIEREK